MKSGQRHSAQAKLYQSSVWEQSTHYSLVIKIIDRTRFEFTLVTVLRKLPVTRRHVRGCPLLCRGTGPAVWVRDASVWVGARVWEAHSLPIPQRGLVPLPSVPSAAQLFPRKAPVRFAWNPCQFGEPDGLTGMGWRRATALHARSAPLVYFRFVLSLSRA